MNWRAQITRLEHECSFDIVIFVLEQLAQQKPTDADVYIFLLFRLRELWLESDVYWSNISLDPLRDIKKAYYGEKLPFYAAAAKRYFAESYQRFSRDPEYLYYVTHIVGHIPWYFGVSDEFATDMAKNAVRTRYNDILEMADHYQAICHRNPHDITVTAYAKSILNNTSLEKQLATKGSAARFVIGKTVTWAKNVLEKSAGIHQCSSLQHTYVRRESMVSSTLSWKEQVRILEQEGSFDIAIFVLEKQIKENPDDIDAYIFLLYRLMDLFLKNSCYWFNISKDPLRYIKSEYYDAKKWQYVLLTKKSFEDSYARFSENPEYLYYAAKILVQFYWYIDLGVDESLLDTMYAKAKISEYNILIEQGHPKKEDDTEWAARILNDPSIQHQLATKGAAAEYVIGDIVDCARRILKKHGATIYNVATRRVKQ